MLAYLKHLFAMWKWKRSEVGLALREHTREFFYRDQALAYFSEDAKTRITGDFHQQVFNAIQSENPVMAVREKLCEYVLEYAPLVILSMGENDQRRIRYMAHARTYQEPYVNILMRR